MNFDELTARQTNDATRLETVENHLAVFLLQSKADSLCHHECDDRSQYQQRLESVDNTFHRHLEVSGDDVGRGGGPQNRVERHTCSADCRAHRRVAWAVEQVMLALVASYPRLNVRVDKCQQQEHNENDHRNQDVPRPGVSEPHSLEMRRHKSKGAVGKADVPVGLGSSRHRGGVIRAIVPNRVDRNCGCHKGDDTKHEEEEPTSLCRVDRQYREAHNVLLGFTRAGVLGVFVNNDEHQVQNDEDQHHRRKQKNVERVEASHNVVTREFATEQEEGNPRSDDGHSIDHSVNDSKTVTREQVIGE